MTPVHHGRQGGACEYKIMFTLRVFSSLLTFLLTFNVTGYWIVRMHAFPFTFSLPTTTFSKFLAHFRLLWNFVLTTENIERSHLLLTSNAVNTPNKNASILHSL
jgi:hypothetical protein